MSWFHVLSQAVSCLSLLSMSAGRALFNIRLIDTKFKQGKMVLAEMAISGGGTAGVNTCIVRHENLNCNETELYIFTQFCVKKMDTMGKRTSISSKSICLSCGGTLVFFFSMTIKSKLMVYIFFFLFFFYRQSVTTFLKYIFANQTGLKACCYIRKIFIAPSRLTHSHLSGFYLIFSNLVQSSKNVSQARVKKNRHYSVTEPNRLETRAC